MSKNKFGLVYRNAITENEPGKVNIHPVTYQLHGIKVAANVYTPSDYDPNSSYKAIVVAHPNGGVKEQTAGLYAQRLAELGYITISADSRYQGASGGEPRHTDLPSNRIEDIRGMIDFISKYPGVDHEHIGSFGICGGGGYSLGAAQGDKRIKAIATLSMFNSGRVARNGFEDTETNTIIERLNAAAKSREALVFEGKESYLGKSGILTDEELGKIPYDLYREGYEYYVITHHCDDSVNFFTEVSLMDKATWDAETYMWLIGQPLLMMAGSIADTRYMTDDAFIKATGTKNKEIYIIDGATHIQTYWVVTYVNQAVEKLAKFFGENL